MGGVCIHKPTFQIPIWSGKCLQWNCYCSWGQELGTLILFSVKLGTESGLSRSVLRTGMFYIKYNMLP